MGWIKVEQSLITHHKTYALADALNISTAEAVGILVGLWTWALDNVDENGTLPDMSNRMMQRISGSSEDGILPALIEIGFIDEYPDGHRIHDWQSFGGRCIAERKAYEDRLEKARKAQAEYRERKKEKALSNRYDNENITIDGYSDITIASKEKKRKEKKRVEKNNIYTPSSASEKKDDKQELEVAFEVFWSHYPKKNDKQNARKAFLKLNPDSSLLKKMTDAVDKQKTSSQWKEDGGRYIPYGATWLNGRRWEDEVTVDRDTKSDTTKESGSFQTDDFFSKATERANRLMNGGKVGDAV